MSKKLRIIFSGIENSGKTTLAKTLAPILGYELIEEQCRFNPDVIKGEETPKTLLEIHSIQENLFDAAYSSSARGVVCDTSGVELEVWAKVKFRENISCDFNLDSTLYFFCHTLKDWEEDPLRGMPDYNDRLKHQEYFESCLREKNIPYIELQDSSIVDRVAVVVEEINAFLNG